MLIWFTPRCEYACVFIYTGMVGFISSFFSFVFIKRLNDGLSNMISLSLVFFYNNI